MTFSSKNVENDAQVLNAYVARSGLCSRRHAVEYIRAGRISVNGTVEREPGFRVSPTDEVLFDNAPLTPRKDFIYIMLNKPLNCECTRPTRFSERTVYDCVNMPDRRLFTVGRLDKNSTGLILLTDDGEFAQKLAHPRYELKKVYAVTTRYALTEADAVRMEKGIEDEGELLKAEYVDPVNPSRCYYHFTLKEGKKREVRRLVAACDNRVQKLCRIAFGSLDLGDLPTGHYRELTVAERDKLLEKS